MNAPPPTPSDNPFPGLRPFREEEEPQFFGREAQVDTMVDKLAATRFLAVVGSSGSGKSSLVNCGLIPALHRGLMGDDGSGWRVAVCRPGNRPIHALAQALVRPGVLPQPAVPVAGYQPAELVESTLRLGKLGLVEAYRESRPLDRVARPALLVVVDQFEELFRYQALGAAGAAGANAGEEATAFVNLLLELAAQTELPLYVVITMRSDYLGECARFFGLPEAINRGQYLVPRMGREQRRAAIAGPLRLFDADIEPVLLTRLVNDVGDNPDQLSILQHALNRTWARWRAEGGSGPLALRHYDAVGTMEHALDQHADEAHAELPDEAAHALCAQVFKAITDRGTDARGTRRPTRVDTLCAITGATLPALAAVMAPFRDPGRAFLMPPQGVALQPDTPIDISHESLMRVWGRLRAWVDEEARSAQTYRRLAETAALHQDQAALLLQPPELPMAVQWRERQSPNPAWAERYRAGFAQAMAFLAASEADWARQRAELAARQRAEDAQRHRDAKDRLNKRWLTAVLPVALLAILGLAWLVAQTRSEADRATNEAHRASSALAAAQAERAKSLAEQAALAEQAQLAAAQSELALRRQQTVAPDRLPGTAPTAGPGPWPRTPTAQANQPLVYLQYADERQKALAEQLQGQLKTAGYVAPGIEKVGAVPSRSELRYFRREDEPAAQTLAQQLSSWGAPAVTPRFAAGYAAANQQRAQYELWLARPGDNSDLGALARRLNAADKDERLKAGQLLQSSYAASPEAIAAVLALFDAGSIDALTTEGRINALYYLSRTSPSAWTPALERNAREAMARVLEREKAGNRLGEQTRAELGRTIGLLDRLNVAGQARRTKD